MAVKGDFTDHLGRVYGIYVGGFAIFVIAMAILEVSDCLRNTSSGPTWP